MVRARVEALEGEAAGYRRRLTGAEARGEQDVVEVMRARLAGVEASIQAMRPAVVEPVVERRPRKARETRA